MKRKTAYQIINPRLGKNVAKLTDMIAVFSAAGWKIDTVLKEFAGHTTQLATEAPVAGYDLVIGHGGDGTLNQVINGVMAAKRRRSIAESSPGGPGEARRRDDLMTVTSISPSIPAFTTPVILFLTFWALSYWPLAGFIRVVETAAKRGSTWVVRSRVGKWAVGHSGPIGSYAPIILVLIFGGIAAIGAGYLFVELAEATRLTTSAVYRIDQAIHTWFGHERQTAMTILLDTATNIGGSAGLGMIVAVVAAILFSRKERASAIFVVVTAGTGALLNLGLKMIFARVRPDLASAISVAQGYSFPSGHAMGSFITFGALTYIVLRQSWPWGAKSAGLAIAMTMVVLVGLSRVYLGVHWASDIAGGWSAGTVWLVSAVTAFEIILRLRDEKVVPP